MACVNVCVKNAISIKDNINAYNSFIDKNKCVECNRCKKICPRNTEVECKKPILWKEGWAKDEEIRSRSSSGGFATAIMKAFIVKKKGYVFSCVFEQGKFKFKIAETPEECDKFTGSKYIKSNPGFIYRKILELLRDGYKAVSYTHLDVYKRQPYGDVMPCNGTKDKEVMGNLNEQSWNELWNSKEAEEVRKKVRCCDRDCWMIGSVSPAMHKYIWVPALWVMKHKFLRFFKKKKYSMYENKIVRDYKKGLVTKEELDKCSTCDMCALSLIHI